MDTLPARVAGINDLVNAIQKANQFFLDQTQRQVNTSFTLRNWIIGYYLAEYEQKGEDRAEYGERLIRKLSERLKDVGIKGLSHSNLQLFKQIYNTYPQTNLAFQEYTQLVDLKSFEIVQTLSGQSEKVAGLPVNTLISRLSFSHFIELIKAETILKRVFYETETINNNWSVRDLQRAMHSMLFERAGGGDNPPIGIILCTDKSETLVKYATSGLAQTVFVSKYMTNLPTETELQNIIAEEKEKAPTRLPS